MTPLPLSAWALVAANLLPLGLAADGSWGLGEVLTLYWAESGVIGFFTVFKILSAGGPLVPVSSKRLAGLQAAELARVPPGALKAVGAAARVFLAGFFIVHFGGFMAGHGVFLFGLVLGGFRAGAPEVAWLPALFAVKWGVLALFLSHGVSFFFNYLAGGEYRRAGAAECMMSPYGRIVVMHLTILLGAFASLLLGTSGPVLVVFVALKIAADVRAHLRERAAAAGRAQQPAPDLVN